MTSIFPVLACHVRSETFEKPKTIVLALGSGVNRESDPVFLMAVVTGKAVEKVCRLKTRMETAKKTTRSLFMGEFHIRGPPINMRDGTSVIVMIAASE